MISSELFALSSKLPSTLTPGLKYFSAWLIVSLNKKKKTEALIYNGYAILILYCISFILYVLMNKSKYFLLLFQLISIEV